MEVSLRNVLDDELDWLYQLNKASYHDVVVRQFGEWDEGFQCQMFRRKWQQPRAAMVVMLGPARIGLVVLERKDEDDWLQEIQIELEYQGRGLGTQLIQQFIEDARSRKRGLRLQVLKLNHRAKSLYERLGFQEIKVLENHYRMAID